MKTYKLINENDGNDQIEIEADNLIDAAIDGLSSLGWILTDGSDDASDYHAAKAAPDLLSALFEIVEHAERYGAAPFSAVKMFDRARAAIEKATGKQ